MDKPNRDALNDIKELVAEMKAPVQKGKIFCPTCRPPRDIEDCPYNGKHPINS